jgi:diguanylate cyclase (GGDEF)-like protein
LEITRQKILLVDDDEQQRKAFQISLREIGRVFLEAEDGDVALDLAVREKPDVILTDYHMPHINGIELVQQIRGNPFTAHIPVIMVSAEADPAERVAMIRAGVDDVVLKPYDPQELAARVDMVVARCNRELSTDSLTRLPGNVPTRDQITRRLASGRGFALCYLDIDNFKSFVDRYGYERGSRAIASVARLIERSVRETGQPSDFVGHIGGDDFALLVGRERARPICDRVMALFSERMPKLYDDEDREKGCITAHDRDGTECRFPIMSLSAVIVSCSAMAGCTAATLAGLVARLKAQAKAQVGNTILEYDTAEQAVTD